MPYLFRCLLFELFLLILNYPFGLIMRLNIICFWPRVYFFSIHLCSLLICLALLLVLPCYFTFVVCMFFFYLKTSFLSASSSFSSSSFASYFTFIWLWILEILHLFFSNLIVGWSRRYPFFSLPVMLLLLVLPYKGCCFVLSLEFCFF